MRISHLKVENYRGLLQLSIPMSNFGCLIGENNVGKSSILQALALFFSGSSLAKQNFYDAEKDIRIEVTFTGITEDDLFRLAEEHRQKIKAIIQEGNLTLVRRYRSDGKGQIKYLRLVPKDPRFDSDQIDALLRGKRPGAGMVAEIGEKFPELREKLTTTLTQTAVRELIQKLADESSDLEKELKDVDLPTGIDKSIVPMLPE